MVSDFWYNTFVAIYTFIGVIGFVLNVFVIHFLLRSKSISSKAESNRCLLVNLALSDMVKLVFNVPLKLISGIFKQWIFGDLGCQIYGLVDGFAGILSTSTLAIMAIERYSMIKNPLNSLKKESIIIIIVFSWLYSLFWSSIQLFSQKGFVPDGMLISCTFDYFSDDFKSRFIIISILFGGFLLPFILLLVFYLLLLKSVKAKNQTFSKLLGARENISSYCSTASVNISVARTCRTKRRNALKKASVLSKISENIRRKKLSLIEALIVRINFNRSSIDNKLAKREYQVTKTVILCISMFCISWLPHIMIIVFAQFGNNIENYITPLTASLPALFAKSSAIFNPLIYTLINPECKIHLKHLFGVKSK